MQWIPCSMVKCISIEGSAFHVILPRCMEYTAFNHAAWNSLHSIGIHCATMHGIHCVQFKSIAPCCMESTAFYDTAWNPLHPSGCILPCCMESTAVNRDPLCHIAGKPLHSIDIHCAMRGAYAHGTWNFLSQRPNLHRSIIIHQSLKNTLFPYPTLFR